VAEISSQAIEGYICSCDFKTLNKKEFTSHVRKSSAREGKGTHTSRGRCNMETGDITMPPWKDRTDEQKALSVKANKDAGSSVKSSKKNGKSGEVRPARQTDNIGGALEISFVPRVFQCDYTPIMRAAREFVINEWAWRHDMPFANIIDTILNGYFQDREIILAGYIMSDKAKEQAQAMKAQAEGKTQSEESKGEESNAS